MKKQFFLLGICLSLLATTQQTNAQTVASNQASTTQNLSDEEQPSLDETPTRTYFHTNVNAPASLRVRSVKASNGAYEQGSNFVNVGIGLGTYYGSGIAFGGSYEYGFSDAISGGAFVGYSTSSGYGSNYNFLYVGVRAAYHFVELFGIDNDKLDLYGGASLGYRSFSVSGVNYDWGYGNGLLIGPFVGARYMFSPNVGGYSELGYGIAALQLGLTFKF